MVVVALAWLLWPLLRSAPKSALEGHVANATIYRDQFTDLDADLRRGSISEVQHAEARAELERRLLDEGRAPQGRAAPVSRSSNKAVAAALVVVVPLVAGLLYAKLGAPDAFSPIAQAGSDPHQMSGGEVEKMLQQLQERLAREPDNIEGWVILARTYYSMRRFPEAAAAYEKLIKLAPGEPDLLTDYADALAMSEGRKLEGRPLQFVMEALKINPEHWKALAMAGTAAFDRKDYKLAVTYWEKLRATQPADSPIGQSIVASINEARQLAGMPPLPVAASPAPAAPMAAAKPLAPGAKMPADHPPLDGGKTMGATSAPSMPPVAKADAAKAGKAADTAAGPGMTVSGTVSLGSAVAGKASPQDMVFVYARPADGSKMPLAILKAQVKDLPLKFTLDDSMAMSPASRISGHEQVVIAARVAKSGGVVPQSGDLETVSKPIKVGSRDIVVTIDSVVR